MPQNVFRSATYILCQGFSPPNTRSAACWGDNRKVKMTLPAITITFTRYAIPYFFQYGGIHHDLPTS